MSLMWWHHVALVCRKHRRQSMCTSALSFGGGLRFSGGCHEPHVSQTAALNTELEPWALGGPRGGLAYHPLKWAISALGL
jgi:hypothetical protein